MVPELEPVESSAVSGVYYDQHERDLFVTFVDGERSVYVYRDVSQDEYEAFMAAPSKGSFLNTEIKPKHRFAKLEGDDSDDTDS